MVFPKAGCQQTSSTCHGRPPGWQWSKPPAGLMPGTRCGAESNRPQGKMEILKNVRMTPPGTFAKTLLRGIRGSLDIQSLAQNGLQGIRHAHESQIGGMSPIHGGFFIMS